MLIDTFVNAIFLYDDKMVITFNYKDGTDTITFDDLKAALDKEKRGSDLDCLTAPNQSTNFDTETAFQNGGLFLYICPESLGIIGFPVFFYFQRQRNQADKSPEAYRAAVAALAWVQKPLFFEPTYV